MIGWYIGIFGIIVGIMGGFFFFKSIFDLKGDLKESILYLVIAALIYVIFSSIMIIFGIIRYEITNFWWQAVPVLYSTSAIFFVIGTNKLIKLLEGFPKNKVKK